MKFIPCLIIAVGLSGAALLSAADAKKPEVAAPSPVIKDVNVAAAAKLLDENKKVVVLDIRTPKEYEEGHLSGATNLNFYDGSFQKELERLDKNQTYLVHCASGGRSAKTRDMMKKMNFQSVYHLDGGFKAWEKAGKPIEKGK